MLRQHPRRLGLFFGLVGHPLDHLVQNVHAEHFKARARFIVVRERRPVDVVRGVVELDEDVDARVEDGRVGALVFARAPAAAGGCVGVARRRGDDARVRLELAEERGRDGVRHGHQRQHEHREADGRHGGQHFGGEVRLPAHFLLSGRFHPSITPPAHLQRQRAPSRRDNPPLSAKEESGGVRFLGGGVRAPRGRPHSTLTLSPSTLYDPE